MARELERRWEQALRDQRELEEQYDRFLAERPRELTAEDLQRIKALAADVPGLWHASGTTVQERQRIVRCLVERITVAVRGETEWVDVTIRWAGGMESRHAIRRSITAYAQLSNYKALRDRMAHLRRDGATIEEIAERLNAEGFHPPRGVARFDRTKVNTAMVRMGLLGPRGTRTINPADLRPYEWRLRDLAAKLEMPRTSSRRWFHRGWVLGRYAMEDEGCLILWADDEGAGTARPLALLAAWGLPSCTSSGGHNTALTTEGKPGRLGRKEHSIRPQAAQNASETE